MWTHGHFYWNELMTRDVEKAKDFYARTLGWTYEDMPMPEGMYYVARDGGEVSIGGIMAMPAAVPPQVPSHWFGYIAVDDVDKRAAEAEKAGGKLVRPIFDVPEVGRIAIVEDPSGANIGWITPAAKD